MVEADCSVPARQGVVLNRKQLYRKIDAFYGIGLADFSFLRPKNQLIYLNSGAQQILYLRSAGAVFLLPAIGVAFFIDALGALPFIGGSITMIVLSRLFYPELMRIHKIRVAAGREVFSTAEGRGISESICQSQIVSGREEKWRMAAAFGLPGAVMLLGIGLMSLVEAACQR